jgi:hypothetical protein
MERAFTLLPHPPPITRPFVVMNGHGVVRWQCQWSTSNRSNQGRRRKEMSLLFRSLCLVVAVGVVWQLAHGRSSSQPNDKTSTSTTTTSTVTNNTATTRQRMLNLHEKNIFQYLAATRTSGGGKTTTTTKTSASDSGNGTVQADELDADFRIVGGTAAPAGKYPFYVNTLRPILCGGTLIHPDIVLTAARTLWMFLLLPLLL